MGGCSLVGERRLKIAYTDRRQCNKGQNSHNAAADVIDSCSVHGPFSSGYFAWQSTLTLYRKADRSATFKPDLPCTIRAKWPALGKCAILLRHNDADSEHGSRQKPLPHGDRLECRKSSKT